MKKILISLLILASFSFTETIAEIQGKSMQSEYLDKKVTEVYGIVTYKINEKYNKGMYIQSEEFDNDDNTSEAIYVEYKDVDKLSVGDLVVVSGKVGEKQFAKFDKTKLTVTTIFADNVEMIDMGLKPKVTEILGSEIPKAVYDDNFNKIDRKKSAMDFYESLEGMVVRVRKPYVAGLKEEYGDIYIIPELARNKAVLSENGGVLYNKYGNERNHTVSVYMKETPYLKGKEFISSFTPNPGDKFKEDIVGILTNDNYTSIKIIPTEKVSEIDDIGSMPDKPEFKFDENKLNVVSYNIENYSHFANPERTPIFAKQVKDVLNTPDIINLVEVGDDDGEANTMVVSSSENGKALEKTIKEVTGIEYGYLAVDPEHGKDGGNPSLHIRNALLYRKDRLKVVNFNQGDAFIDTEIKVENDKVYLTKNPGRIANYNTAFNYTRKPLVALFEFKGKNIYAVSLHLSSKRGDDAIFGVHQPPIRKSEINRHKQAEVVSKFLNEIIEKDSDATVLVMGDYNDFHFSRTTDIIKGSEFIDVINELPENKRYSYVFEGMSQTLDNIVINKKYSKNVNVDVLRINSEFTKSQGSFSDHDPIFIQFEVK